ncbi:DMT family transporter [Bowmanella dokdonensis]|uniref:EamA family transporter n=1 Tax=Bowmanella dokdonensis TaxID=751969 RepID=A0A939IR02_9ALTE|nr:EamA family transporter [Bowmanella dokdonensis]MBN7824971.1 EamA family transporter [Bowmanella dokdonensis]
MKNFLLYLVTVLIWGSTWLAIEFQLGVVAAEVSLVYRFAMAALLMWGYCLYRKLPMRYDLVQHGFFILLAAFNFCFNYLVLYWAQEYLTSALASIAFTTLLLMNIVNTRLFFGRPIAGRIYAGALLGIIGIVLLFWTDVQDLDLSNLTLMGLLMALSGTLFASLGNMVSVRNSARQVGILQGNAWGMLYGTGILSLVVWISGAQFTFDTRMPYVLSLLYLSVFGTVIAFACYFVLLKNIGPERASYVIVLFPLVAVVLSTWFEGFVWHANTVWGFLLVLTGNALVLTPLERFRQWRLARRPLPQSP